MRPQVTSEHTACSSVFTCIGALGTPSQTGRGPSLESIYRVSLTVDLCEGNKIISFKKLISPQPVRGPSKRKKNPGALGTCPVCPLVKTALTACRLLLARIASIARSAGCGLLLQLSRARGLHVGHPGECCESG